MIYSSHKIFPKEMVDDDYIDKLYIDNPKYAENERLGFSNKGTPKRIQLFREEHGLIKVPRHYPENPNGIKDEDLDDRRVEGSEVEFDSNIKPRDEEQKKAIEALAGTEDGVLVAPCGSGKTVLSLDALAQVGTTTLVLVHKGALMEQWQDRIEEFLNEEAGIIRGDKWDFKDKKIVIATLQTLYSRRNELPGGFLEWPGLIVSDEVHRVSAPTFSRVIQMFPSKRRWGLTATPKRADGLEQIFYYHLGGIIHQIDKQDLEPKIIMKKTGVGLPTEEYYINGKAHMSKMVTALTKVEDRNRMILNMVLDAIKYGRKILLLTGRVAHTKLLKRSMDKHSKENQYDIETSLFIGEMNRREREKAKNGDIIFATSQMAKEGLDIPDLDTLFLTSPTGSEITTQQAVGRILREYPGKATPMVIDFVDEGVGLAEGLGKKRYWIYKDLGYEVKIV